MNPSSNPTEVVTPEVPPGMEVPNYVVDLGAPFPRSKYIIRIIEEEYKKSQKGKDMLKLQWEAVYPEAIRIGRPYTDPAKMFQVKGLLQGFVYVMLDPVSLANDKTGRKFLAKLGVPVPTDPSNPLTDGKMFKDTYLEIIGQSKMKEQVGQAYDEQGNLTTPVLTDENGKPIMSNQFSFFFNDDSVRRRLDESQLPTSNAPF